MPRILLSAGEHSGDRLGAGLVEALRGTGLELEFVGLVGPKMRDVGVRAVANAECLNVMGYAEVLWSMPRILQVYWKVQAALHASVDLLVVIDAPDFNIRLARKAHSLGIPVVFLGSPQVWAWRGERAEEIARIADEVLCFFPFEPEYYRKYGGEARWIGHPVASLISDQSTRGAGLALLPGSRRQELQHLGPVMAKIAERWTDTTGTESHLACAPGVSEVLFKPFGPDVRRHGDVPSAIQHAAVALVCSGTATLEVSLLGVPQVVVYKTSAISYRLAKRKMPGVSHIALPNLLAEPFVPEFVQDFEMEDVLSALLEAHASDAQRSGRVDVRRAVSGGAHCEAAERIVHWLRAAQAG